MINPERKFKKTLGTAVAIGLAPLALSACTGTGDSGVQYSPKVERALQKAIQPELQSIGSSALAETRTSSPLEVPNCFSSPAGKSRITIDCDISAKNKVLGNITVDSSVYMDTLDGKPEPSTTYYVNYTSDWKDHGSEQFDTYELVAPRGDSLSEETMPPQSGWETDESTSVSEHNGHEQLLNATFDTSDSDLWASPDGYSTPTSPVGTAKIIVSNIQTDIGLQSSF